MTKSGFLLVALLALLPACGTEPVPARPSFEHDIKPLTVARCVRCHGGGGMLNADPRSSLVQFRIAPVNGFFDQPDETVPNCMAPGAQPCHGLGYYMVGHPGQAAWMNYFPQMPPGPAAKLSDREKELLENFINEATPVP